MRRLDPEQYSSNKGNRKMAGVRVQLNFGAGNRDAGVEGGSEECTMPALGRVVGA